MKKGLLGVLGCWLIGTVPLFGQTLPPPVTSRTTARFERITEPVDSNAPAIDWQAPLDSKPYRIWGSAEFLTWWVKNAPLPLPLVTTGDPNVGFPLANTAGAIGQPGTQVLFGGTALDFHNFSGMRFTLGGWIGRQDCLGIEASGFLLGRRTNTFTAASDQTGNPPLYFPRFNPLTGTEGGVPIADPLRGFSGNVVVTSTLQLWGTELNGIFNLIRRPGLEVSLLTGLRYADLRESLHIQNTTTDFVFNNTTVSNDFFGTRNQFYGGQIGAHLGWQRDRLYVDVNAKVALGSTHQVVNIQGDITQLGPNALVPPGLGRFPGGLFAQPSNIGQFSSNPFTVLPAVELKVGYQVNRWMRVFAGYDVMYWNQVVRPGNQISHSVNLTQNAVLDPNGVGVLVGPAQPAPRFNRSDFWAQGVTFGLEFCY